MYSLFLFVSISTATRVLQAPQAPGWSLQKMFLSFALYDVGLSSQHCCCFDFKQGSGLCTDIDTIARQLFAALLHQNDYELDLDPRIAEALAIIEQAGEKKLAAQEISDEVFLSTGRFGHLFKEVVGVPLRRYLLWRRLLVALEHVAAGKTFTFAAHEAGFTDSAHLSRTFRQMFGLSLSAMFAQREQVIFVFCDRHSFSQ